MSAIYRQRLLDIANLIVLALDLAGIKMKELGIDDDLVRAWQSPCRRVVINLYTSNPNAECWDDVPCLFINMYMAEDDATATEFILQEGEPFFVINDEKTVLNTHLKQIEGWEIKLDDQKVKIPAPQLLRAILMYLRCSPNLT